MREKCVRECGYVCSCSCSCGGRCNVWHIDVHAVMRFVCEVPHVLDQSIEPQCLWDFWRERIHVHHAGHGQRVKREVAMMMPKERVRSNERQVRVVLDQGVDERGDAAEKRQERKAADRRGGEADRDRIASPKATLQVRVLVRVERS